MKDTSTRHVLVLVPMENSKRRLTESAVKSLFTTTVTLVVVRGSGAGLTRALGTVKRGGGRAVAS